MFEHFDAGRREEAEAVFAASGQAERFFGNNEKRARLRYKHLAAMFHPDLFAEACDKRDAESVFKEIGALWEAYNHLRDPASAVSGALPIDGSRYRIAGAVPQLGNRTFKAFRLRSETDDCAHILFVSRAAGANRGYPRALDKIAQNGVCGHLFVPLAAEAFILMQADGEHVAFAARIPDEIQAGLRSLAYAAASGGPDPKDVAWIWRRLVSAAAVCADLRIGFDFAPDAAYIEPEHHGYIHMCIDPAHERYAEGLRGAARFLSAICERPPAPIQRYFTAVAETEGAVCAHPAELLADFDYVLKKTWGARKFHAFSYPKNWV
jgi:hypothetical protein